MQRRTKLLFAVASSSCLIGEPIGDTPDLDGTGSADTLDPSSDVSGDVGDGHSSDPDDGDDGSTTGDGIELCTHAPSGVEPGTILWSLPLEEFYGGDVVRANGYTWLVGNRPSLDEATLVRIEDDGGVAMSAWDAPPAADGIGAQIFAMPGGRIVATYVAVEEGEDDCIWCFERWVVGYDDIFDPAWELSLGEGTFAASQIPGGNLMVVGSTSTNGEDFALEILEIDEDGEIVRTGSDAPNGMVGVVSFAAAGSGGDVVASGPLWRFTNWRIYWDEALHFGDGVWNSAATYALARAANGDNFFVSGDADETWLVRQQANGSSIWELAVENPASEIESDCDDSIVLASSLNGLERRDGDGTLQWHTDFDEGVWALDVADDGSIYVVLSNGPGPNVEVVRYAGL